MAGLWMTVMLVFLLSAGGLATVDKKNLANLMQGLKNGYKISGMFSLALSIPSEDPKSLQQIFEDNPRDTVEGAVSKGSVYKGTHLAVAGVKKPEHAEYRLLKDFKLVGSDLLVIYSYASSCPSTCTNTRNPYNIIGLIRNLVNSGKWKRYAFVFETLFKPQGNVIIDEATLRTALEQLNKSGLTLANIFRCYRPVNRAFHCISCSKGGKVAEECVDYNAK